MKNVTGLLVVLILSFVSCKKEVKTETETAKDLDSIKTEEPVAEAEVPLDSAAQAKAWQDYATPGEPHKIMAEEAGTWNCEMTFWYEPNGKPEKATSTANVKMVLGGRYQESDYKGTIMGLHLKEKEL